MTVTLVSRAAAAAGGESESADSTLLHQVVFHGKTGAVHPGGPYAEGQLVAHSATHWATEDTLMTLLEAISDLCGSEHFLIVFDVAPKHTSALFCDRLRAEMPNAHLFFVPAGHWLQEELEESPTERFVRDDGPDDHQRGFRDQHVQKHASHAR